MLGPFKEPPFSPFRISPIGNTLGKKRLIIYPSSPHGTPIPSINSINPAPDFSMKYASIDQAITLIHKAGHGAWLSKGDITSAFKVIPIQQNSGISSEHSGKELIILQYASLLAAKVAPRSSPYAGFSSITTSFPMSFTFLMTSSSLHLHPHLHTQDYPLSLKSFPSWAFPFQKRKLYDHALPLSF